MKRTTPLTTALATALALALAFGAFAQTSPDAAREKELAAAREDLQRAARRVAELSRDQAGSRDMVFERRLLQRPVLGVILEADEVPEYASPRSPRRAAPPRRDYAAAIASPPSKASRCRAPMATPAWQMHERVLAFSMQQRRWRWVICATAVMPASR